MSDAGESPTVAAAAKAAKANDNDVTKTAVLGMHIKVYSPFKTYYDEAGQSVSGVNGTGPFDILPHHHNFITLLEPCDLVIHGLRGDEQRIRISGGLMHVKADRVTVFLDI